MRWNKCKASSLSCIQSPTKCLDSWRWAAIVESFNGVYKATNRCLHSAASSKASVCIWFATVASPSSISARITKPAPLTIASDGCCSETNNFNQLDTIQWRCSNHRNKPTWNSLNIALPRPATISNRVSNCLLSVVSLYGTHRANVKKSNIADRTSAPLPKFTCSTHVFNRFSKNAFDDRSEDLLSCSCLRL